MAISSGSDSSLPPEGVERRRSESISESSSQTREAPGYIIRIHLKRYIMLMQHGYSKRLSEYEKTQKILREAEDIEKCGMSATWIDEAKAKFSECRKPRSIYIDPTEIEGVARQGIESWMLGGFKCERANHRRLVMRPFKAWLMVYQVKRTAQKG